MKSNTSAAIVGGVWVDERAIGPGPDAKSDPEPVDSDEALNRALLGESVFVPLKRPPRLIWPYLSQEELIKHGIYNPER